MKEVEANKAAWGLLSKDHYEYCKKALQEKNFSFSKIIEKEIEGEYHFPFYDKKIPFSFSLKARLIK